MLAGKYHDFYSFGQKVCFLHGRYELPQCWIYCYASEAIKELLIAGKLFSENVFRGQFPNVILRNHVRI